MQIRLYTHLLLILFITLTFELILCGTLRFGEKAGGSTRTRFESFGALAGISLDLYLAFVADRNVRISRCVTSRILNWQRLSSVPFADIATHSGRVALALVDPVVVLAATVWGITRGSDAVSGQLERGTMEMVLAQPVSRTAVYITQAIATTSAAAFFARYFILDYGQV